MATKPTLLKEAVGVLKAINASTSISTRKTTRRCIVHLKRRYAVLRANTFRTAGRRWDFAGNRSRRRLQVPL
jgi:hypothetical protein